MSIIKKILFAVSICIYFSFLSFAQTSNMYFTLKNIKSNSTPLTPVLLTPPNSGTEVSTTPTLRWLASSGAVYYKVQVSTSSSFSSTVFDKNGITDTSIIVNPTLSKGTTYYWHVNAWNGDGPSNWSETRSFKTIIEAQILTIDFAGLRWNVSNGYSGPGPNNWSNGINSVWVDNSGNLHLAIRKIGGNWYCSGITAQDTMGYGEYSFSISSNVELYDPNIVVGLFVYKDDSKEIDIEFSKWGDAGSNSGLYVVQPTSSSSSFSFPLNLLDTASSHKFTWTAQNIKFQSYRATGALIKEWIYNGSKNPIPNQMKPHINFWLFKGSPPTNQNEAVNPLSLF